MRDGGTVGEAGESRRSNWLKRGSRGQSRAVIYLAVFVPVQDSQRVCAKG
jgi:hypothetical protein